MLFNTFQFFVFFSIVVSLYYALPHRRRWILLLSASLYFYAAYKPINILLLFLTLIVDYTAGRLMEASQTKPAKLTVLFTSIAINVLVLFSFKYLGFTMVTTNYILDFLGLSQYHVTPIHLDLPVGISFYTFQSMSYVIDAYRKQVTVEKDPLLYFTYVTFFPQLVAGPIERAHHLLPQFRTEHFLSYDRFRYGLQISLWGMFKKVVIADSLSVVVNTVYNNPHDFDGLSLFIATLFFAIQIYCDFSGYSDIAIGVAKMLGFDLMTNFRQPYLARSIADFWQRWHISLTTWFRDYVYIPLGGNRVGPLRWATNVSIVFLLSGIWHGANFTFVIWGALHAAYFLIGRFTEWPRAHLITLLRLRWVPGLVPLIEWGVTMLLVVLGWIFFRANTVTDAFYIVGHVLDFRGANVSAIFDLGLPRFEMAMAFFWIVFLMGVDYCLFNQPFWVKRLWSARIFRHLCYQVLFWAIAFFGVFKEVQFIYFAF